LQTVLRQKLAFEGAIFSDDLSMKGASVVGGYAERVEAAIAAGCDMVLVCNDREGVIEVIDNANITQSKASSLRLKAMKGRSAMNRSALLDSQQWSERVDAMTSLC
jgi:beta-N-acetylhexosaminidase